MRILKLKIFNKWGDVSIRTRLAISFTVLIVVISAYNFLYFPGELAKREQSAIRSKAETVAELVAGNVCTAQFFGDTTVAAEVVGVAMRNEDVVFVEIRDTSGVLFLSRRKSAAAYSPGIEPLIVLRPVIHETHDIGVVTLGISLDRATERILHIRALAAGQGIVLLLVGALLVFGVSTAITRPLGAMALTAKRIASGDHTQRVSVDRHDEVGNLGSAINAMLDTLNGAEQGLIELSLNLEERVTESKLAEENTKRSEERFRLIAENVGDMIAVLDLEGRRTYNSPSYKSILGDPESLKGTNGFREIHPDDVERVKQVFHDTVRTGIGQRIEYRFLSENGSERTIDSKGSVIRDTDGTISSVVVVSRDVTEEKKLAAQFLRAQRMDSIGTLAGGIAHDLNNVLAPIMMAIELLRNKISDPAGQRIVGTIESAAKRGSDIVKQVLAFGRGVKGDRILVQLKHVVNEVVKISGGTFPKSISIKKDIPRDLWTVSADPTQMHQVLLNMLVNARDAMPGGGTLTISAENVTLDKNFSRMQFEAKPGTYVCIVVTDTGTGIPADIREKIFEPFFTTKEIGMGTGLGLSTTLAIVRSHGGFIDLETELGKGTTFKIYIPATGTDSVGPVSSNVVNLPMGNGELILIIDDEAAIREITKESLEAYGYKAMTASDGAEGVAAFAENKADIKVVITDIMMPVMDGTAAILALKRISPDLKIIAASGLTFKGDIKPPPESSVQAFLTKPYTAEKLLKALAEALQEA